MALDSKHPDYTYYLPDWIVLRDLYEGERQIKAKGTEYLPATAGMELDGMKTTQDGYKAYESYKMRAVFHDYIREAVEMYIGLMSLQPPTITLPASMEPLRDVCSVQGESIELLLRKINVEQLITGRVGILADLPKDPTDINKVLPRLSLYYAETVHNWNDSIDSEGQSKLDLVIINESEYQLDPLNLNWDLKEKYKVLTIQDGKYVQGNYTSKDFLQDDLFPIMYRGKTLNELPFVFVNTKDIISCPDSPPLLGLASLTLAIYRGEADYRHNLYMQGQDTLVIIGNVRNPDDKPNQNPEAIRTGAGSRIDVDIGGDAKYIGVSSAGLSEQRNCLDNDKKRATVKSGQLISTFNAKEESGKALTTRIAAQTATLNQIAHAGAEGLQKALRKVAMWIGANPEEVVVKPNVQFADLELNAQEIVYLMTARSMGAPISLETIHALMAERDITKFDYDKETDLIDDENVKLLAEMKKKKETLGEVDENTLANETTGQ